MAFWDWLLGRGDGTVAAYSPQVTYLDAPEVPAFVGSGDPASLYSSQPALRTVVSFLAQNVAQLKCHLYRPEPKGGRERVRSEVADLFALAPNRSQTAYEFFYAVAADKLLCDTAYIYAAVSQGRWQLYRIPPNRLQVVSKDGWGIDYYKIKNSNTCLPPEAITRIGGYSPTSPVGVSPAIQSLKDILDEQKASNEYRRQIWRNGGRVSSVIERPAGAPPWSDKARADFREDWRRKFGAGGAQAGGTPVLEDGMTLKTIGVDARASEWSEGAKLSAVQVAAAFHVPPEMLGLVSGTYSNIREYRRMLYGETLGPLLRQITDAITAYTLPYLGASRDTYAEHNIEAKLRGNFAEQAQVMSSSVGAPWLTRNEARRMNNLPALPDGDELITPLNVLAGGQASPVDSGAQNLTFNAEPREKSTPDPELKGKPEKPKGLSERLQALLEEYLDSLPPNFFGGELWRDAKNWPPPPEEIAYIVYRMVNDGAFEALARRDDLKELYDPTRVEAYAKAAAAGIIADIALDAIRHIENNEDWRQLVGDNLGSRSENLSGYYKNFGAREAAKQTGAAYKTWLTTSAKPRPTHAAMHGQRVRVDEPFSNGMMWPFDSTNPEETVNCSCFVQLDWED